MIPTASPAGPQRPSRKARLAGVYFSVLTGLPWLAMLALLTTLAPRIERLFAEFKPRGVMPATTRAAIGLSHAVDGAEEPLAAAALCATLLLGALCLRAKSRGVIVTVILSGSVSVVLFLVLAGVLYAAIYQPLVLLASRAAGHS